MNKLVIGLIVVVIAGVLAFSFSGKSDSENVRDSNLNIEGEVNEFVITGENFKFVMDGKSNPDIIVNKGERVRIEFSSTQGFHDWVVDEFEIATKQVKDTDGVTFAEFTADKTGTFEYYCSVGEHRANGMKGNLIVR
ncbi:MAG: cupredoxin domain-containing protein [Nanoarchaeota archaeon]